MKTCSICKHERRGEIEAALIQQVPCVDIGERFDVGKSSVDRHKACMQDALRLGRERREIQTAINVDEEIRSYFITMRKLRAACDDWLTDPDDPEKFTLDARATETSIIYDHMEPGADKPTRKRAPLSNLIALVEQHPGVSVVRVELKHADPRQLVINSMKQLLAQADFVAKLQGLYKLPAANPQDRMAELNLLIEAIQDRAMEEGHPCPSRAECLAEILQQPVVFESVLDLAKQEMATEAIQ